MSTKKIGGLCSTDIGTMIEVREHGFPAWSGVVDYLSHVRVPAELADGQPDRYTMICLQANTCQQPCSRLLPSDTPCVEGAAVEAQR